jgi:hypothetical protein
VVSLGDKFAEWARDEAAISGLVMIGSQVREAAAAGAADAHSDFDFQVITTRPGAFEDVDWWRQTGLGRPIAQVIRGGRLGSARKATVLFPEGEIDLVVLPATRMRRLGWLARLRLLRFFPAASQGLVDLATVLRGGYRVIKGEATWGALYRRAAQEVPPIRLSDEQVRTLADGFVCDYVSTRRKIERGELIAAQRWLHLQLVETNFKLLHELRQRAGQPSFPDARRIEFLLEDGLRDAVSVEVGLEQASLSRALEKSAGTCRLLVRELLGPAWQWPDLTALFA